MGRVWYDGAALHGGEPRGSSQKSVRGVRKEICGPREDFESWQWSGSDDRNGAVHQRTATADGDELRRDWKKRRRETFDGRKSFAERRARQGVVPRADGFWRCEREDAHRAGRNLWAGNFRDSV